MCLSRILNFTVLDLRYLETVFSLSCSHLGLGTRCLCLDFGLETWCLGLGLEGYCLALGLALTVLIPSLNW